jgi:hypothetical protein
MFIVQPFLLIKTKVLSQIDLSGISNYNTFSVVPSTVHDKAKNVLFHWQRLLLPEKVERDKGSTWEIKNKTKRSM